MVNAVEDIVNAKLAKHFLQSIWKSFALNAKINLVVLACFLQGVKHVEFVASKIK